jgi:hypothetical protein
MREKTMGVGVWWGKREGKDGSVFKSQPLKNDCMVQ